MLIIISKSSGSYSCISIFPYYSECLTYYYKESCIGVCMILDPNYWLSPGLYFLEFYDDVNKTDGYEGYGVYSFVKLKLKVLVLYFA